MVLAHLPGRLLAGAAVLGLVTFLPAGVAQAAPGASATAKALPCRPLLDLHHAGFRDSLTIDNRYLPMVPGTRLTYEGAVTGRGAHEVVFTVSDLVKDVDGVRSRVIYDVDRSAGVLAEAELAFFAQDDGGNVWNLGEYPEEYDAGKFSGAPSVWLSGREGAVGGLHMLSDARRRVGGREYLQGVAPKIDFLDCARVADVRGTVDVPAGHFGDVLTTFETSPLESTTAIQTKEHAPGVGIVRIGARNDPQAETLRLVKYEHLGVADRIDVARKALALDAHGRKVSHVYDDSAPLRPDPCAPEHLRGRLSDHR